MKANSITAIIRKFIYTIIIPTVIAWVLYLIIMNVYFINDSLRTQQMYLQSSVAQLDLTFANVDNLLTSIKGSPEIVNYLNIYDEKRDMLYLLVKSVRNYCENLVGGNISVRSLKIYSTKDSLLFSDPFYRFEEADLTTEQINTLYNSRYGQAIWVITPIGQEKSTKDTAIPSFYAYDKIYSFNSGTTVGYIAVELHPEVMKEYFSQFNEISLANHSSFLAFHDKNIIYNSPTNRELPIQMDAYTLNANNIQIHYLKNEYFVSEYFEALDLTLIMHGSITDLITLSPSLPLGMIIAVLIVLLFLVFAFFVDMNDLSKQILHFSNHIKSFDPANLASYEKRQHKTRAQYTELNTLIGSFNSIINENTTLMTKVSMMELLNQDAKYQALQAQIHPHFLFGTLENIRMLALQNKDPETAALIFSLATVFRHALSSPAKGVTLTEEMAVISHYMTIQTYRFGERLTFESHIVDELSEMAIPVFLLQPLVENAIVYGVASTLEKCEVKVMAEKCDTYIKLQVLNSGELIEPDRLDEVNKLLRGEIDLSNFKGQGSGLALYNIKERLRIFYKCPTSIRIETDQKFTKVILIIERTGSNVTSIDC